MTNRNRNRQRGFHWRTLIRLLSFVIGHSAILASALAGDPTTRVHLSPADTAYIGQYVRVNIEVLYPGEFTSGPVFDLPEVVGGVILRMDSQGVHGSEEIEGLAWHVVRYNFALFPHQEGICVVPPVRLRFIHETRVEPLYTEPVSLEVEFPPGAEGLSALVSAPRLEAREAWNPDSTELKVGDAITRAITLKAGRVLGMGFPPLSFEDIEGLGVYPKDPLVEDRIERGDFEGERTESVTYVCERPGAFELPAIVIPWFDLEAGSVKRVEFPPRTLSVSGNPELEAVESGFRGGSGMSGFQVVGGFAMVLVLVAVVMAWRYRSRLESAFEARRVRRHESEAAYFDRFLHAARSGEPGPALQELLSWLDRSGAGGDPALLSGFLSRADDPELSKYVVRLTDVLYGPGGQKWEFGNQLARAVRNARSAWMQIGTKSSTHSTHRLSPLNPGFDAQFDGCATKLPGS